MTTNVIGTPARQDPRQVTNTLKHTINFNDFGIASGNPFANFIPQGAFITGVWVEIVTPFNGGTNVLTVGSNSPAFNNIVASGDVNAGVVGVTPVARALGRGVTALADQQVFATYTQTGAAATAGQAIVVIQYEGGFLS
jgi:hypothetical protein